MGQFTINTQSVIRNRSVILKDTSFAFGVASQPDENQLINQYGVSEQLKTLANQPEWSKAPLMGFKHYFLKHNDFKDQELYDRIAGDQFERHAHAASYYVSTYDPSSDMLWHEDNLRDIDRVFEIRIQMELQPDNELYQKLGITGLDEIDAHIHMTTFMQQNYQNLLEMGKSPTKDIDAHNPILYQRGYDEFNYHGFGACDILPKSGDLVKLLAFDRLYQIESITDTDPLFEHRYRKYFWKVSMKEYRDDGKIVSDDVKESPINQGFIDDMFGQAGVFTAENEGENITTSQFDVSPAIDEAKKEVLYRPKQVPKDVEDVSKDSRSYPGFDNYGGW